jgi:hypothetical protein
LPLLILAFPLALEPGDHRRREVRRVLAEQGREEPLSEVEQSSSNGGLRSKIPFLILPTSAAPPICW